MQFPSQNLQIDGVFIGIQKNVIPIGDMTVFIGPQAAGKSVIARLVYFFRSYVHDIFIYGVPRSQHKATFDKQKKSEFMEIFPPYSWYEDKFRITYKYEAYEISISSERGSSSISLNTSSAVANDFRTQKRRIDSYLEKEDTGENKIGTILTDKNIYDIIFSDQRSGGFYAGIPDTLFVPAARAFYAFIRDEIFSMLSIDGRVDPIIVQFGKFYEGARKFYGRRLRAGVKRQEQRQHYLNKIIKADYFREDNIDWLKVGEKRVEVRKASSGQQEALPLIFAISDYPQSRTKPMLIIEEPEAHLFPTAQKDICEFIVYRHQRSKCQMFMTTHSPYILTCLNNSILKDIALNKENNANLQVQAYWIDRGKIVNLIDSESQLINAEKLDEVSIEISEEFENLLESLPDE